MELILNTYGVSLNREGESFVITSADGRQRIPSVGITSIQISRGAQITSDAVLLAIEHEIEVLFMDKKSHRQENGEPAGLDAVILQAGRCRCGCGQKHCAYRGLSQQGQSP